MPDAIPITLTKPPETAAPADPIVAAVVEGAPATPPAPAEAAPAKPVEDPIRVTERLAQLARREQAFVQEQRRKSEAIKAQEASIKAQEEAFKAKLARYEEFERLQADALKNPAALLRKVYGDNWYDRLTQYKLEGEQPTPDLAVQAVRDETRAEIERLRQEQREALEKAEAQRKADAEAAAKALAEQEQAVIDQFHRDTIDFVKAHADDYELTNLNDAQGLVVQVIEETFKRTKKIMSAKEAAEAVEKHLEEVAAKNFESKKWKARAAKPTTEPAKPVEDKPTLTNAMGSTPSMPAGSMDRYAKAVAEMEAAEARRRGA